MIHPRYDKAQEEEAKKRKVAKAQSSIHKIDEVVSLSLQPTSLDGIRLNNGACQQQKGKKQKHQSNERYGG